MRPHVLIEGPYIYEIVKLPLKLLVIKGRAGLEGILAISHLAHCLLIRGRQRRKLGLLEVIVSLAHGVSSTPFPATLPTSATTATQIFQVMYYFPQKKEQKLIRKEIIFFSALTIWFPFVSFSPEIYTLSTVRSRRLWLITIRLQCKISPSILHIFHHVISLSFKISHFVTSLFDFRESVAKCKKRVNLKFLLIFPKEKKENFTYLGFCNLFWG